MFCFQCDWKYKIAPSKRNGGRVQGPCSHQPLPTCPLGPSKAQPIFLESGHRLWSLWGVSGWGGVGWGTDRAFLGRAQLGLAACFSSETPAEGAAEPPASLRIFSSIPCIHLHIISSSPPPTTVINLFISDTRLEFRKKKIPNTK